MEIIALDMDATGNDGTMKMPFGFIEWTSPVTLCRAIHARVGRIMASLLSAPEPTSVSVAFAAGYIYCFSGIGIGMRTIEREVAAIWEERHKGVLTHCEAEDTLGREGGRDRRLEVTKTVTPTKKGAQ